MIVDASAHREAELNGDITRELVAVRYVGPRETYSPKGDLEQSAHIPGTNVIWNKGVWRIMPVPDEGLDVLERHEYIEIAYDPETMAEALLQQTTLPDQVFGNGYDRHLRDKLFEKLDLEDVGIGPDVEEEYANQLREIAGVEPEESETLDSFESSTREMFISEHTRKELRFAAINFDMDPAEAEGKGKIELAEYLVEQPIKEVKEELS